MNTRIIQDLRGFYPASIEYPLKVDANAVDRFHRVNGVSRESVSRYRLSTVSSSPGSFQGRQRLLVDHDMNKESKKEKDSRFQLMLCCLKWLVGYVLTKQTGGLTA
jgi:hypothetical protein